MPEIKLTRPTRAEGCSAANAGAIAKTATTTRILARKAKVAAEISGLLTLSQLRDPLGGHSSVVELRDDDRLAE